MISFPESPAASSEGSVGSPELDTGLFPEDIDLETPVDAKRKNSAESSSSSSSKASAKKRSASAADIAAPPKVTKRRAARACVSCRARKVRCDVVENSPCGNCRWDNVECVVQESRRRRKNLITSSTTAHVVSAVAPAEAQKQAPNSNGNSADPRRPSTGSVISLEATNNGLPSASDMEGHVPHMIYQRSGYRHDVSHLSKLQGPDGLQQRLVFANWLNQASCLGNSQLFATLDSPDVSGQLPAFVRPLPSKINAEDVKYLSVKGALALPDPALQSALLQAYVEYVHPYMPLLELHDFLSIINARDGLCGQISLLLFQAIMFSATAFVDMKALRDAGYPTRKAARKAFFQKTRLLYDFDYESDRLILVQALLLMTYWYETPDDQKDTWHWMGVAISLAHTIGLHRNPAVMNMPPRKQKLWKRIWWSCFMRDRLVALGMRRPTRIKDEDFDVPMLEEGDFEMEVLSEENTVLPSGCTLIRDLTMQRELALMCIAKAQLCICISHMLKAQYSVLIRDKMKPDNTVNSTMMLFPNKRLDNIETITSVDLELMRWAEALPPSCHYRALTPLDVKNGRSTVAVQRTLLHMVYYTTISALHRPQFLPSSPLSVPTASRQVQEMARLRVRDAALHTTRMAAELHSLRLDKFLPTTGVTVVLPAMIIHLLEMKNPVVESRERAMRGFRQCMKVLEKLREIYSAADYAAGFLDAALRKAAIDISATASAAQAQASKQAQAAQAQAFGYGAQTTPPPENAPYMTGSESDMFVAAAMAHRLRDTTGALAPTATLMPALEFGSAGTIAATSPPQTEREDLDSAIAEGLTPSASGGSSGESPQFEHLEGIDFDASATDFDWGAVTGTEFDVDQWLQFPNEGMAAGDEGIMSGSGLEEEEMTRWVIGAELQDGGRVEGVDVAEIMIQA